MVKIPVEKIRVSPLNVRAGEEFGDEDDLALGMNIEALGLLEPVIIRPFGDMYELASGRRRFLAVKRSGAAEIDCVVRDLDDVGALDVSLSENIFRKGLDPVTLGRILKRRLDMEDISLSAYARRIGKAKSTLSEWIRMNDLNEELQREIQAGNVPFVYALKVARMELSPEEQRLLAEEARVGGVDAFKRSVDLIAAGLEKRGAPRGLQIVRINFGQESPEYEDLKRLAEAEGSELSDYCRKILIDHLQK